MWGSNAQSAGASSDGSAAPRSDAFFEQCRTHLNVALQPIYSFQDRKLFAVESLMAGARAHGLPHPHAVLDKAAEEGVLHALELRQVEMAVRARAETEGLRNALLFVNVDGRIVEEPRDFLEATARRLSAVGAPASSMTFEMSERHDRTATDALAAFLDEARRIGFNTAIDDVGVGVADLQALALHRFDYVKIDRFFVDGAGSDARRRYFIATLAELTHSLGAQVIVEGVETEADYFACRDVGCDCAQGYLIGRPTEDYDAIPASAAPPPPKTERMMRRESDVTELERVLSRTAPLRADESMGQVIDALMDANAPTIHPVVDEKGEPVALLHFDDLRAFLASPFGLDLMRNRSAGYTVRRLSRPCVSVDISVDLDAMITYCASSGPGMPGLVLTKDGKYEGYVSTTALLSVSNSRRLLQARDENPLTRLPGNRQIEAFIDHCRDDIDIARTIVYFDFDNFKPFNDYFGFRVGDRAILMFASLLRKSCQRSSISVGHIGGDDFFVGFRSTDVDEAKRLTQDIVTRFACAAVSFYGVDDRRRGYIDSVARDGSPARAPLLRASAALLHFDVGVAPSETDLTNRIAQLKKRAKGSEDGFAGQILRLSGEIDLKADADLASAAFPAAG